MLLFSKGASHHFSNSRRKLVTFEVPKVQCIKVHNWSFLCGKEQA